MEPDSGVVGEEGGDEGFVCVCQPALRARGRARASLVSCFARQL